MGNHVEIENIDELRRRQGIDDVELREAIAQLRVGDFVQLTLRGGATPAQGETLRVRVTRVEGSAFRGTLAQRPVSAGLAQLRVGARLTFTAAHIHSLPRRTYVHEQ